MAFPVSNSLSATVAALPSPAEVAGRAPAEATPKLWESVAVYGLGASGVAVARLLRSEGVHVVGLDDSAAPALPAELNDDPHFELRLGVESSGGAEFDLSAIAALVVSPGVPRDRPLLQRAQQAGVPCLAEVEVAFRVLERSRAGALDRLVGITGSNGKSTTTQLVAELLGADAGTAVACGNIGTPLSACVAEILESSRSSKTPALAVELSSFQLEGIDRLRLPAAAVLNISPDHLDRHGSPEEYLAAKLRIFERQLPGDVAVLNADDPALAAVRLAPGVRRRQFSLTGPVEDGCHLEQRAVWLVEPDAPRRRLFSAEDLRVVGDHNIANAMAATLLALSVDAEIEDLSQRVAAFSGLPHRTQFVAEADGVRWFDDSKGTNIGATQKCLEGFADASVHLIAGGRAKGVDFAELRSVVAAKVARLYLVGEAADELDRDLGDLVPVERSGTIGTAVQRAQQFARNGEVVLLSPACASFDQYTSFVERGLFFQREVQMTLARVERAAVGNGSSEERSDG